MAKFVHTKIISIAIFLVVDLALASTLTQMLKTIEPHQVGDGRPNWRPPIGPIVQVWFHNRVGTGEKIAVHPRAPKLDYGSFEIKDNESDYIEIVGYVGNDIQGDFKWGHREAGGNVYVHERDTNRCTITPMRWICNWNITVWGVVGVNDKDQADILFKWN